MTKISQDLRLSVQEKVQDGFLEAFISLFLGKNHGHMEQWEYEPSHFPNDPAGGSENWANLVQNPGQYYLPQADINTIKYALMQKTLTNSLLDIETIIEFGPGSSEALLNKTLPFISSCQKLKKYIAIDGASKQAVFASKFIQQLVPIQTESYSFNYFADPLQIKKTGKTAIIMWGGSIGNIEGEAGSNPFHKLVKILRVFESGLIAGDLLILSFDTEDDKAKILRAYNEPLMSISILSPLFGLKRDGYASGHFDPKLWRHESVWFPEVKQCAHMIYPLFDQKIRLGKYRFKIPAWKRVLFNNSYKFTQQTMQTAVDNVGLKSIGCFQKGPVALLAVTKAKIL